ncbi:acyltransferase [Salinibacterium sp. SWN1162]|uniref:acyltransferase family protein n=1 Tax=Salinibacterium sp. SWN1162 TaxID=2792053 RepID=UPI0018CF1C13|nr:acyltransferase [Salinibacterium sp. SWN1162]MBH0008939.1 acyltransferase [Salinibacterium sp. SWN1162]
MRAFAVMLVVLNHAGLLFVPGQSGVTIFFAISGFVITYVVLKERQKTGRFQATRFYANRALKLAPPLVVLILVPTAIYSIWNVVNWWVVASQVFFTFNWVRIFDAASAKEIMPGSGVTWSLAVEEQFYIAFALLWLLIVGLNRARGVLAVVAIFAIAYSTTLRFMIPFDDGIYFVRSTVTRLDSIAWGVLAAVLYVLWLEGRNAWLSKLSSNWTLLIAIALYVGSAAVPTPLSYTCQSLAAVAVILWGLLPAASRVRDFAFRLSTWAPVETIGLASYSIYLGHASVIFWIMPLIGETLPPPVFIALGATAGTLLGMLTWRYVELPVLRWRKARIDPWFSSRRSETESSHR